MTIGRPSKYTRELADTICGRMAAGESLRATCESIPGLKASTVVNWAMDPKHEFFELYTRARQIRAELLADELLEIADNSTDWQKDRLRIDTRKWMLSKLLPKLYGDRIEVKSDTTVRNVTAETLTAEALALRLDPEIVFGRARPH